MNIHKNARLTPLRREEMALSVIAGRLSQVQAARLFGVSAKIVARWVERFKAHGRAGMTDPVVAARVVALGRQRWTGQHIALEVGVSPATVSRVLRSAGLSRLKDIAPTASDTAARAIHKRASRVAPAGPRRLPRRRNRLLCQPRRHRHPRYDRQRPKCGRKWAWQAKFLCPSACSRCMTLVKSHRRTRRLPLAREKVSSIANTGSIILALTVLNTSFCSRWKTQALSTGSFEGCPHGSN